MTDERADGVSGDPVIHRIRVRYCETDRMGLAHHMNHVAWFEEARTEWLRAHGRSYRDLEDEGYLLQIVELKCRYHAPLDYDDVVRIETRLVARRRVGITLSYRLLRESDEVLAAVGETSLCCVSPEGRIRALPEDLFSGRA